MNAKELTVLMVEPGKHPKVTTLNRIYIDQLRDITDEDAWHKAVAEIDSFHDLRHLCASIMMMQGINVKICSAHLGHKDISTTLNIYSHVLPSVAKEAVQKIGDLVYEAG